MLIKEELERYVYDEKLDHCMCVVKARIALSKGFTEVAYTTLKNNAEEFCDLHLTLYNIITKD
jgi:hypothetical protein